MSERIKSNMDIPFDTQKEGLKKLEDMVQQREKARGSNWYQVWQKDCKKFANKLLQSGADEEDIATVMSWTSKKDCYCGIVWY